MKNSNFIPAKVMIFREMGKGGSMSYDLRISQNVFSKIGTSFIT